MPKLGTCCNSSERRHLLLFCFLKYQYPSRRSVGGKWETQPRFPSGPVHVFSTTKPTLTRLTKQTVAPLRSPGFPVKSCGFGELHAALSTESRTRGRWSVLRSRNSGYAAVGMTNSFEIENFTQ